MRSDRALGLQCGGGPLVDWRVIAGGVVVGFASCATPGPAGPRPGNGPSTPTSDSTTAPTDPSACVTDTVFYAEVVHPAVHGVCASCHVADGLAGSTRYLLTGTVAEDRAHLGGLALEDLDGWPLLLQKATGAVEHGGGVAASPTSATWAALEEWIARSRQPGGCEHPGPWPIPELCPPDHQPVGETPWVRLPASAYVRTIEVLLGVSPPADLLPTTDPTDRYRTWADANPVSDGTVDDLMLAAEAVSTDATADLDRLLGCPAPHDCALDWATGFAERAFRRPLLPEEQALVQALYDGGVDPGDGVGRVIEGVLQMPQFLFLELAPRADATGDVVPLDDYAVAARLSYALTGGPPTDALRQSAAQGELRTVAQVREAARELLADAAAADHYAAFHDDWLQLGALGSAVRDPERYPSFDAAVAASLRAEAALFASEVVWLGDGTVDAVFHSTITWTDPAVDAIYGTEASRIGSGWERREVRNRPGVLGRAAFLAAHADPGDPNPVRRGAVVLDRLLCEHVDIPPGLMAGLPDPIEGETLRDRLAAHTSDPACSSCHSKLDPLGFALEHYDAIGAWRDTYSDGLPIDATGSLDDPAGSFDGLPELIAVLDSERHLRDCYVQQTLAWSLGRRIGAGDACTQATLADRFDWTGGDLRDLLVHAVSTDAFRMRLAVED